MHDRTRSALISVHVANATPRTPNLPRLKFESFITGVAFALILAFYLWSAS